MRALGLLFILLACLMFMLALLGLDGGAGAIAAPLSLLACALMVSGSVFASAAWLGKRLDDELRAGRAGAQETTAADAAAGEPLAGTTLRRPGFRRTAA